MYKEQQEKKVSNKKKFKKWAWNLTRQFSKEVIQMVKNMKKILNMKPSGKYRVKPR